VFWLEQNAFWWFAPALDSGAVLPLAFCASWQGPVATAITAFSAPTETSFAQLESQSHSWSWLRTDVLAERRISHAPQRASY